MGRNARPEHVFRLGDRAHSAKRSPAHASEPPITSRSKHPARQGIARGASRPQLPAGAVWIAAGALLVSLVIGVLILLSGNETTATREPTLAGSAARCCDVPATLSDVLGGTNASGPVEPIALASVGSPPVRPTTRGESPYVIRGTLREPSGYPIRDGDVMLHDGFGVCAEVRPDRNGAFEFRPPDAGRYTLLARSPHWCQVGPVTLTLTDQAPVAHHDLHLFEAGYITGRATWSTGEPLSRVRLEATPYGSADFEALDGITRGARSSKTQATGSFRIGPLDPGRIYQLHAGNEYDMRVLYVGDVLGGQRLDFVYDRARTGAAFTGALLDETTGAAIPAPDVTIKNATTGERMKVAIQRNRFRSIRLPPDARFDLTARSDGYEERTLSGLRPGRDIDIALARSAGD